MKSVIEKILEIPCGRFFRVLYRSNLPVKAEYKKNGISITKYTSTTTRTGVQYSNIKGVVPSQNKCVSYYHWIQRNRLLENDNTMKQYIQFAPIGRGSNKKTVYMIHDNEGTRTICESAVKEYVIPSYFSKKESPKVIHVSVDNIIEVNA